ncbi:MAG: amidophosphoribosyltransferase, partial [Chitinophagales bacterium]
MSDFIKHECGIALVRLLKPLQYYIDKYGTVNYALNKMYLLMEKQHNRGQDGAGLACLKLDTNPGEKYIHRWRSNKLNPIQDVMRRATKNLADVKPKKLQNAKWLKENINSIGEMYLGHLRYGTHGGNSIQACHPFVRKNNWRSRNLVCAGNFNLTNNDELMEYLIEIGQHPIEKRDTVTVMEKIGHFLDVAVQELFDKYKILGYSRQEISDKIESELDIQQILSMSARDFDGGYAMCGLIGHGDAFVLRDPNAIRPVHYYQDDEIVVVASERPCIQTAFNVPAEEVKEIPGGSALIIKKNGDVSIKECLPEGER